MLTRFQVRKLSLLLSECLLIVLVGSVASVAAQVPNLSAEAWQSLDEKWGARGRERIERWLSQIEADLLLDPSSHREKLEHANTLFNQIPWKRDAEHWYEHDYWATPFETLGSNAGDCEDFSIGKFFTLRYSLLDPKHLRLTYVKSLSLNQSHMVLTYYATPDSEPLILDNIDSSIKLASEREDLLPIYSFNVEDLWLAKQRSQARLNVSGQKISSESALPKWKALLERMTREM